MAHLLPQTYSERGLTAARVDEIFLPYAGHVAGGTVAGLIAASVARLLARISPRSAYPAAWDDFVRSHASGRWLIVGLQNGDIYAGRLANADISVPTGERDVVLAEPCLLDPKTDRYVALNYQYLFLPAGSLYSIAAVYEPTTDSRLVAVGEPLFEERRTDGNQQIDKTGGSAPGTDS